jgi:hypothetical protein
MNQINNYSMPGYLKLTRNKKDLPIILYQEDEEGNINLDPKKIGIIKTRIQGSRVTLGFDSGSNYKFMRYEVLGHDSKYSQLKKVVDEKLSKLSKLEEELRDELEGRN